MGKNGAKGPPAGQGAESPPVWVSLGGFGGFWPLPARHGEKPQLFAGFFGWFGAPLPFPPMQPLFFAGTGWKRQKWGKNGKKPTVPPQVSAGGGGVSPRGRNEKKGGFHLKSGSPGAGGGQRLLLRGERNGSNGGKPSNAAGLGRKGLKRGLRAGGVKMGNLGPFWGKRGETGNCSYSGEEKVYREGLQGWSGGRGGEKTRTEG